MPRKKKDDSPKSEPKVKPAPPPAPGPAILPQHVEQLRRSMDARDAAYAEMMEAAAVHKERKARYEAAVETHEILEKQIYRPERETFALEDKPAEDREPEYLAATAPPDDTSWRDAGLKVLNLPYHILNALHESDLFTLGQLADYTAKRSLTEIVGIGVKSADAICEACIAFYARGESSAPDSPDGQATEPVPKPPGKPRVKKPKPDEAEETRLLPAEAEPPAEMDSPAESDDEGANDIDPYDEPFDDPDDDD